jgi:hypothetical protein
MDAAAAADRWTTTWARAWPAADADAIAALYAPDAVFYSHPFRERQGPREYVEWVFADQAEAECRFGAPVAKEIAQQSIGGESSPHPREASKRSRARRSCASMTTASWSSSAMRGPAWTTGATCPTGRRDRSALRDRASDGERVAKRRLEL